MQYERWDFTRISWERIEYKPANDKTIYGLLSAQKSNQGSENKQARKRND